MDELGAPKMALLEAKSITKRFGGLVANKEICLEVNQGEVLGLIGPNGAGKTTFFNVIAGVYRPDSGRLTFEGREISSLPPYAINRLGIARTFQIPRPFPSLTVLENVIVGLTVRARGRAGIEEAAELIAAVGLTAKMHAPAGGLSTGQRKRLELAKALSTNPKLLLLDEVTGGVDQRSIPGLIQLVHQVRDRGVTLVVIEHNTAVMRQLADRIVAFHLGEVIAQGTPAEVAMNPDVIKIYLGDSYT